MILLVLFVSLAFGADRRVDWSTAAGRAEMCRETGYGCKEPNTTRVLELFRSRHGDIAASSLEPVILVPGLGGSGLQASIDKNYKPAWECFKKWTRPWSIWVNLYEAAVQTCWFDNLMIRFNETSNQYENNPGVTLTPRDFGGISGVDKVSIGCCCGGRVF